MRKARGDAKLKTLPDPVQRQLFDLYQKKSSEECLAWLLANHGVKSSAGPLSSFSHWYPFSRPLERAALRTEQFAAALKSNPNLKFDAAQSSEAAQIAFEQFTIESLDLDAHIALRNLRLKEQEQKLSERRIVLLEQKAAQADAGKAVADATDLSPEEQLARFKQVFGAK